jgi:hypothetical protein
MLPNMRDLIIGGLLVAAVIILIRVIIKTPMARRVMESFQSGGSSDTPSNLLNTTTECPSGSQLYMYEGVAYCCNGQVNPDADTVKQSCRPLLYPPGFQLTFCTLGPPSKATGVKNCLELRSGLMAAEGIKFCPTEMPNYTTGGPAGGRCCTGPTNTNYTDCADSQPHCDVLPPGQDPLTDANSCDFKRLAEADAASCPSGYHQVITAGQGPFAGLNIYGCTNMTQTCYSPDMFRRLDAAGKDVRSLQKCAPPS